MVGKVPAAANLHYGFVDVRDVAAIHITAMTHEKAAGHRFIANAKEMWLIELTTVLNKAGYKKHLYARCQIGSLRRLVCLMRQQNSFLNC